MDAKKLLSAMNDIDGRYIAKADKKLRFAEENKSGARQFFTAAAPVFAAIAVAAVFLLVYGIRLFTGDMNIETNGPASGDPVHEEQSSMLMPDGSELARLVFPTREEAADINFSYNDPEEDKGKCFSLSRDQIWAIFGLDDPEKEDLVLGGLDCSNAWGSVYYDDDGELRRVNIWIPANSMEGVTCSMYLDLAPERIVYAGYWITRPVKTCTAYGTEITTAAKYNDGEVYYEASFLAQKSSVGVNAVVDGYEMSDEDVADVLNLFVYQCLADGSTLTLDGLMGRADEFSTKAQKTLTREEIYELVEGGFPPCEYFDEQYLPEEQYYDHSMLGGEDFKGFIKVKAITVEPFHYTLIMEDGVEDGFERLYASRYFDIEEPVFIDLRTATRETLDEFYGQRRKLDIEYAQMTLTDLAREHADAFLMDKEYEASFRDELRVTQAAEDYSQIIISYMLYVKPVNAEDEVWWKGDMTKPATGDYEGYLMIPMAGAYYYDGGRFTENKAGKITGEAEKTAKRIDWPVV